MKKIFVLIFAALLACAPLGAQNQSLAKLADIKGITYVYMPEAMIQAMGGGSLIGGMDIDTQDIKSIQVVTASDRKAIKEARKACSAYLASIQKESLMQVIDDGTKVNIYSEKIVDSRIARNIIIETEGDGEYAFVLIEGVIPLSQLGLDNSGAGEKAAEAGEEVIEEVIEEVVEPAK